MNKFCTILYLSLAAGTLQASSKYDLQHITEAITASDIAQVKAQWRRLDSAIESLDERKSVLESLIKVASKLADDSKGTVAASGVGVASKDYRKVAGGLALWSASLGAMILFIHHKGEAPLDTLFSQRASTSEKIVSMSAFTAFVGCSAIGGHLFRVGLGWEGATQPIAGAGRSKAAIVLSYLEGLAQELKHETLKA